MASKITMYKIQNTIAAGATTGSTMSSTVIRGKVLAVKMVYSNSTPASTSDRDINIFEMNPNGSTDVTKAIQEVINIGTLGAAPDDDNGIYYPKTPSQDNTGTDVTYDGTNEIYEPFIIFGKLNLAITAAAAGDITTAYVLVEEY